MPPPPPSSEAGEATLRAWRATVLAAHEQTRTDLDALQGRPISLMPAGRWVLAASSTQGRGVRPTSRSLRRRPLPSGRRPDLEGPVVRELREVGAYRLLEG